jgi:hypothetical protein
MNTDTVVGLQPWLPGPLARSPWWSRPVPAQRLAALRIGVGLVVMLDVLGTYLPCCADFFGQGSLTPPGTGADGVPLLERHRLLLDAVASPTAWLVLLWTWAAAGLCLLLGVRPRLAAAVAWFFSVSVATLNPALHNSGDQVRSILLFFLAVCPCGAVWSVDAWRARGRDEGRGRCLVYPWPLRLLFLQLVAIYFVNGLFKLRGEHWLSGEAVGCLLGDAGWTRWSFAGWSIPAGLLHGLTVAVLAWELGFPLLMALRPLRKPTLVLGVLFHIGTGLALRIGPFPLYMLCLYLPLVPWERWAARASAGEKEVACVSA